MVFNPLKELEKSGALRGETSCLVHVDTAAYIEQSSDADQLESTSSLTNDKQGYCPKCKLPFGSGIANGENVYYCVSCRVTQPVPQN